MVRPALACTALMLLAAASPSSAALPAAAEPPAAVKTVAHDILEQLVDSNSVHANGSTGLAEALAARLHAAGFAPEELTLLAPPEHPSKGNLVVRLKGRGQGRPVLFIAHLDVVEAKPADWSVDPFQLTAKDDYFYGRGTLDMKGDVAALVTTLIRLKGEGFVPERDIIVAFTADEEAGGDANGVDWLLRDHRDLIDADLAINPDAGGGVSDGDRRLYVGLETSEKVFVTFGLEVTGKGGHSSLPEPDNVIYRLAAGLDRLSHLSFPVRLNATTQAYFAAMAGLQSGQLRQDLALLGKGRLDPAAVARLQRQVFYNAMLHTTCVATRIEGGHAENALPQRARATIQCRMLPDDSQAAVQALLVRALHDAKIEISVITPSAPGPESPPTPAIMARMQGVVSSMWPGVPVVPDMDAGASDSKFTRGAGIPSYGISGLFTDINDNRAHGRDERIGIDVYYQDIEFTYRLVKRFATAE